jgi:hypothetical protein
MALFASLGKHIRFSRNSANNFPQHFSDFAGAGTRELGPPLSHLLEVRSGERGSPVFHSQNPKTFMSISKGTPGAVIELRIAANLLSLGWQIFRNVSPNGAQVGAGTMSHFSG